MKNNHLFFYTTGRYIANATLKGTLHVINKNMSKPRLYVSFDIECDSGYSGPSTANMWELGAVFLTESGEEVDSYSSLIRCRENMHGDPRTKEWLKSQGLWEKYESCNSASGTAPMPVDVMTAFGEMLRKWAATHNLRFVASPTAFDFMYFKDYYALYAPQHLQEYVGYSATCLSSMISNYEIMTGQTSQVARKQLWDSLKGQHEHTHCAIDDAREQGAVFIGLMKLAVSAAERPKGNPLETQT